MSIFQNFIAHHDLIYLLISLIFISREMIFENQVVQEEELLWETEEVSYLEEGIFEGCDFSEVDFSERNFEGVSFRHCLFRRSNLKKVNFKNASFERAIFRGCTLDNANFDSANVLQSYFSWSSIRNANFSNVDLDSIFLVENTAFNLAVGLNKGLPRKFRT